VFAGAAAAVIAVVVAGCDAPAPLNAFAPSTLAPKAAGGSGGPGAAVQIVGVAPSPTPLPVQSRNTGPAGAISTALPLGGGTPLVPGLPDLPALSPPPTATFIPPAAAAAAANAATATAAAVKAAATATALPSQEIRIENFAFSPAALTVPAGTTIVWRSYDLATHQVTGPGFDSGRIYNGQYWAARLERPGIYDYVCTFHPTMRARITVSPTNAPEVFGG
jgi:plastocyanin